MERGDQSKKGAGIGWQVNGKMGQCEEGAGSVGAVGGGSGRACRQWEGQWEGQWGAVGGVCMRWGGLASERVDQ